MTLLAAITRRDPFRNGAAVFDAQVEKGPAAIWKSARVLHIRPRAAADRGAQTVEDLVALPAHEPGDGTTHSGASLHLFAAGVARRPVDALRRRYVGAVSAAAAARACWKKPPAPSPCRS
jgi:hypothetical protein